MALIHPLSQLPICSFPKALKILDCFTPSVSLVYHSSSFSLDVAYFTKAVCGSLNENIPHGFMYLDTWSPGGGTIWEV